MITEIALTPSVLDPSAHAEQDDWPHLFSHFVAKLSGSDICPAVITDLGGLWHSHMTQLVMKSSPTKNWERVKAFLSFLKDRRLIRKIGNGKVEWNEDRWWVQTAFESALQEPIDRIVAPDRSQKILASEFSRLSSFLDVDQDHFWEGIGTGCSIAANRDQQVAKLRKLLAHGEFVWLASPYMGAFENDDSPFAREVIRSTFRRASSFSPPREVRIFTKKDAVRDARTHESDLKQFFASVTPPDKQIHISICDKFEERILLTGDYSSGSSGPERRPRWGVHMGHIAQKRDLPGKIHEWKLLDNTGLSHWFRYHLSMVK